MLISRHITYTDAENYCERIEIDFDPPIDMDSPIGKIEPLYKEGLSGAKKTMLRPSKPIVNANGLLHVKEVMKAGELLLIRVRPGYRFQNLIIDQAHQLQVMPDAHRLQYWITVGSDEVVEVTGEMVKDDDGFFAKLKSNLKDIPFRSYIVQRSLADTKVTLTVLGQPPDLMDTKEAAKYLAVSTSKLYKMAESGELPRTPNKKFRKVDLDSYLAGDKKRKRGR